MKPSFSISSVQSTAGCCQRSEGKRELDKVGGNQSHSASAVLGCPDSSLYFHPADPLVEGEEGEVAEVGEVLEGPIKPPGGTQRVEAMKRMEATHLQVQVQGVEVGMHCHKCLSEEEQRGVGDPRGSQSERWQLA